MKRLAFALGVLTLSAVSPARADFAVVEFTAAIAAFGQIRKPVRRTVTICGSVTIGAGTPGTINSTPGRRLTRPCIGPSRCIAAITGLQQANSPWARPAMQFCESSMG